MAYNIQSYYKHMVLADGTLVIFHVSQGFKTCGTTSSSNCAEIFVDLNGYFNGPNQFGKDYFVFALKKDRIVPNLPPTEQPDFSRACNRIKNPGYGLGCAAWILINENMDYLHCDDLQWNTKTTCK